MKNEGKIIPIQVIRAFAFIGILLAHCDGPKLGAWGVSIFFVLSGFTMMYSYDRRQIPNGVNGCLVFVVNKLKKLYPLHIITMLIATPYELVRHTMFGEKLILNTLLIQSWFPNESIYFSFNAVSWYLSAAVFIYFCFPIILKTIRSGGVFHV